MLFRIISHYYSLSLIYFQSMLIIFLFLSCMIASMPYIHMDKRESAKELRTCALHTTEPLLLNKWLVHVLDRSFTMLDCLRLFIAQQNLHGWLNQPSLMDASFCNFVLYQYRKTLSKSSPRNIIILLSPCIYWLVEIGTHCD